MNVKNLTDIQFYGADQMKDRDSYSACPLSAFHLSISTIFENQ